jgi:uncharacterized protein
MTTQRNIAALLTGALFGIGLGVAQMIDPNKIRNFLDIAGTWDASLMLVLGAALITSFVAFKVILKQNAPRFADVFSVPTQKNIDGSLLLGAAMFGVGWGIAGYCPGPSFAALALGSWEPIIFVLTMMVGFSLHRFTVRSLPE